MAHDEHRPDFEARKNYVRGFETTERRLVGHHPTIAITPVADGRVGAYESNVAGTWAMVERVYNCIMDNVRLADGLAPRIVVAPEIVYGARSGARAQEYYTREGVSANIWVSRSWAYSDELMSACMGIGSSEWIQAAYGLNQTDRPGAVWLKAFCAAMDEKNRPIFSIYNPDIESEDNDTIAPYVATRLIRFARAACAIAEMRGKNYLSIGSVSMGIIGSDVRRNIMQDYFGMGSVSVDMSAVRGRIDNNLYDHEEFDRAFAFMKDRFTFTSGEGKRPYSKDDLLAECIRMTLVVRDLMVGNPRLAEKKTGEAQGFTADVEFAQGANAIAAGTQGQRMWTDLYPNFDLTESILNSSFDWNGFRQTYILATENDSKNALGMLCGHLLTGLPQLFADIRTNWTAKSVKDATGIDISDIAPNGLIDKRNSGAAALDYALNVFALEEGLKQKDIYEVSRAIQEDEALQKKIIDTAIEGTRYEPAVLEYFRGDGLSSSYRTPGGIPMTSYRYNVVGSQPTISIVEGDSIELPREVADHISNVTDATWPETYWRPRGMSSFTYMSKIGPNHDGSSFGNIGADLITLNAMLRIPVDMHNIPEDDIFRPTMWDRYGGDDFRVCEKLGPLFG
jgi:L-fucose isomerase